MSDKPTGILHEIPRAPDLNENVRQIVSDLCAISRQSGYRGFIICTIFDSEEPYINGDLEKIGYHQALGLCEEIKDEIKSMYLDVEIELDEGNEEE